MPFHQLIHNHLLNLHPFHIFPRAPLTPPRFLQIHKLQPRLLERLAPSGPGAGGAVQFDEDDLVFPLVQVVPDDDLVAVPL